MQDRLLPEPTTSPPCSNSWGLPSSWRCWWEPPSSSSGGAEVPDRGEVLEVEKRLVLKEELHIRRRVETETAEVPVTLRKQRAIVERLAPDTPSSDPEKETPQ